ncbi:hypothetical protein POM88_011770 [Heracleum sosnowskyi]|uniref:Uncharacterized protein n=1 Tax=Heracleum sosnowskyi TaxID=360622 RepID=A0AAD8IWV4_9APIA|nr:hypothetical protein POM88_011770 [Heracleum sosnowskyi]
MTIQQTIAKKLDHGLSSISSATVQLQSKIDALHHELIQLITTVSFNSPLLAQKEAESTLAHLFAIKQQDAPQSSKRKPESPTKESPTKEQSQPSSQLMVENPISSFLTKMSTQPEQREKQDSLWQICEEDSDSDSMSLKIIMADPH